MASPFIWGKGGQKMTPQEVERQRQVSLALLRSGADFSPATGGFAEALGRGFQGWASGRLNTLAREAEEAGQASAAQRWQQLQPGMAGATAPVIAPQGSGMAPSIGSEVAAAVMPQGGGDLSLALLREFEGFRETPYWDVNAFRTGYGSDTITTSDGRVVPVREGMRVSREDAERDLQRRVSTEFEPRARQAVGAAWDSMSPEQRAALTSITYNYGSLPESVSKAVRSGQDVAGAILSLSNHNGGINAKRREREAQLFAGGGTYMQPSVQNVSGLAEAMGDPWFAQQYGPVASALMDQQMQMQTAAYQQQLGQQDPAYQIGLEKAQLELDAMRNPAPKVRYEFAPNGQLVAINESAGSVSSLGDFAGPQSDPTSVAEYQFYAGQAAAAGEQPMAYADWDMARRRAGATNVTVGGEGGRNAEFDKKLGAARAERYIGIQTAGTEAQRRGVQIGQLSSALEGAPEGLEAVAKSWLGKQGLKTEGLDKLQLAEALISQLVPAQRPPGSGTISDADLALYKASLPRLINTREGNRLIIDTMNGIMRHDLAAGEIADKVIAGQISPDEGDAMLRALPNPFEGFQDVAAQVGADPAAASGDAGNPPAGIDPADWQYMTPEERALFQ